MKKGGGIYIHVPYCRSKCLYCDFYSAGTRIADWQNYINSIVNEALLRKNEISSPQTIYIGGGTPSIMPVENLSFIIENINRIFNIKEWDEFTLEVNPEDVSEENVREWRKIGVNRVSMGVQTLNDAELKNIGRRHSAGEAINSMKILQSQFDNISLDLMFGLPGQTNESYETSLNKVIEMKPSHISSYSLMLEEGTAMTFKVNNNLLTLPNEDEWIKMFELTSKKLSDAGYHRYEVSNYSLPGKESIHNSNYWEGKPYLGLGVASHSYNGDKVRRNNPNDLKGYINFYKNYMPSDNAKRSECFYEEELLSEREMIEEMIMTRLRKAEGIEIREFTDRFGFPKTKLLLQKATPHIVSGFLKEKNGRLSFTNKGFILFNSVLTDLI